MTASLLGEFFQTDPALDWQMSPSEQVTIMFILEHLKPKAAIEIGTRFGGSLQVLARHMRSRLLARYRPRRDAND